MNDVQSFLDKVTDIYYPNSTYPLSNVNKNRSFGLCEIADKLAIPISINHLNTKNYIIIIANEPIFKCITNYLCKEQLFLITESNIHIKDGQSSNIYLIHSKHINKSLNINNKTKLIYSESQFINLIDIINIPINLIINEYEDLFDIILNSSIIFVYYSPSNDELLNYIAKITDYKLSIGIYTSKEDLNYVVNLMKNQSLDTKVKFIKPLILPSELELIEYLLDYSGNENFRNFYKNLFKVEVNDSSNNMKTMISEIDIIMKNKCVRCYKRLKDDIKSLKSPHNSRELYKKKIEFSVIGTIILLSLLCKLLKNNGMLLSRFMVLLVDNIIFKIVYYMTLCYILVLCVKYTDREFFRQNEESVSNYLNGAELKLKGLKDKYNFI